MNRVPLPQLPRDAVACVVDLDVRGEDATRLKAMGICVGRQVQLVRAGDPLIVRILGTRIGLSERLAAGVTVEPI
jgi:Fe2+ transport system protein FeoA